MKKPEYKTFIEMSNGESMYLSNRLQYSTAYPCDVDDCVEYLLGKMPVEYCVDLEDDCLNSDLIPYHIRRVFDKFTENAVVSVEHWTYDSSGRHARSIDRVREIPIKWNQETERYHIKYVS